MNHQPFREWIFSQEKLAADQAKALQEHLQSCEDCRHLRQAWIEVDSVLHQPARIDPPPGFTVRWQAHLAAYQQARQRSRVWMTMGIYISAVIPLLAVLIYQLRPFIQSPDEIMAIWLNSLASLVSVYYTFTGHVHLGVTYLPVYSAVLVFFLVGMISFMSVLWLAAYRKISMVRRAI